MTRSDIGEKFSIVILDNEDGGDDKTKGQIRIGEFVETFYMNTMLWSQEKYKAHWRKALSRLEECSFSSLAETVGDPKQHDYGKFWLFLREGDDIRIQQMLLVFDECPGLVLEAPWEYFDESYFETGEDEEEGSEWEVSWYAVKDFLSHVH